MSRFLRVFAFVFGLIFVGNAFAATGYVCESYRKYTSCTEGYYMTTSATSPTYNGTSAVGNACRPCSVASGATFCPGGTSAPLYKVTLNVAGGTAVSPSALYYSSTDGWYTGTTSTSIGTKADVLTTLPTKTGSSFNGFYTAASGGTRIINKSGTLVVVDAGVWAPTAAVTLYAQYSTSCNPGTYLSSGTCLTCPADYWCTGGTSSPVKCSTVSSVYSSSFPGTAHFSDCFKPVTTAGNMVRVPNVSSNPTQSTQQGGWWTYTGIPSTQNLSTLSPLAQAVGNNVNYASISPIVYAPNGYDTNTGTTAGYHAFNNATAPAYTRGTKPAGTSVINYIPAGTPFTISAGTTDLNIVEVTAYGLNGSQVPLTILQGSPVLTDGVKTISDVIKNVTDFSDPSGFVHTMQATSGDFVQFTATKAITYVSVTFAGSGAITDMMRATCRQGNCAPEASTEQVEWILSVGENRYDNMVFSSGGVSGYHVNDGNNDASTRYALTQDASRVIAKGAFTTKIAMIAVASPCDKDYYSSAQQVRPATGWGLSAQTLSSCTSCGDVYPYTASTGAISQNSCYLNTGPGQYVETAGAGMVDCPAGSICEGGTTIYYGGTGTTTGGLTGTCEALTKADSGLATSDYVNSPAGASNIQQCYLTTEINKEVETDKANQTACDAGEYCPGGINVGYGITGGMTDTMLVGASNVSYVYNGSARSCASVTVSNPEGATITYSTSSDGTFSTTAPTLTNVGSTRVYYKVSGGDGWTDQTGSYTCTITKAENGILISDGTSSGSATVAYPSVKTFNIMNYHGTPTISSNTNESVVTASISGALITLTPKAVGTATITVTAPGDDNYNAGSITYTLTVSKGTMNASLAGNSKTYNGSALTCDGGTQTGVPSGSTITYSTTNGSGYSSTKPTRTDAGTTTVYYKITNANYNDFTGSFSCTVNKAQWEELGVDHSKPYDGTPMTCTGLLDEDAPSGATIKYGTVSGTYNLTSAPTVTNVADSKTIYFQVTHPNYETQTGSFRCDIEKATVPPVLSESSGNMEYSSTKTFTVSKNTSGGTLSVTPSNSNVATATINGTTVTITSKAGYGTADITVTSAATANYNAASATYKVTVDLGKITLSNQGATTAGTPMIYQKYNSNVYLDSARSKAMTTSANAITIPERKYTVTYDAKDGSVGTTSQTATYKFNGYYSATSGGTQYIDANGKITSNGVTNGKALTADSTWNAQWTSASVTMPTPTRTGHTFNGWYTAASGGTKIGDAGATYTPTANITLYAQWTACTGCSGNTGANCALSVTNNACTYTTTCKGGYYNITNDGKYNASCSEVGDGWYSADKSNDRKQCTTTSGWTTSTGTTTASAYTSCYQTQTPTNCSSGTVKRTVSSISGTTITYGSASVTSDLSAKANYYVSGATCSTCPSNYPNSDGGKINNTYCYTSCGAGYAGRDYNGQTDTCDATGYTITYYDGSTKLTTLTPTSYTVTTAVTLPTPYKSGKKFASWHTDSGLSSSAVTQIAKGTTGNKTYYAKWIDCPAGSVCNGSSVTTCPAGSYCPAGSSSATKCAAGTYSTGGAASCTNVTAGCYADTTGSTKSCPKTCSAGYYCPEGASSQTACADLSNSGGLYKNSPAGATASTQCYASVAAGKYIYTNADTGVKTQASCPIRKYCEAATLYYPNISTTQDCPSASDTTKMASSSYPDSFKFYNEAGTAQSSTITITSWGLGYWQTGAKSKSECKAYYYLTNDAGSFTQDSVSFNTTSGKYDVVPSSALYYTKVNKGYYVKDHHSNSAYCDGQTENSTRRTYYKKAVVCPAGSYCPGISSMPLCYGNPYPETGIGKYSCATETTNYPSSAEKSIEKANCYLTLGTGKFVETAGANQKTCTAGGYCDKAGTKIYYGSTGGRTGCGAGKYNDATGSSSSSACKSITAGCYGTSAAKACPAVCGTNKYSDAGAASCSSCDSDYANGGSDAAAHAGVTSCKVTCPAGQWVATANAACIDLTSGYYTTAAQTVSQGSTGSRNECSSLNAFYTASDNGRDATTDCYGTTTSTKFVKTAKSGEETCTPGGYCPGNVKVYYNSTDGRTACEAPYASSAASSDDANDCYLTTTSTKYVAEAGKGEVTCLAGDYCPGGSTIYKGGSVSGRSTTGGNTPCPAGQFCLAGVSAGTKCVIGSYSSGTGNIACTPCQNGMTTSVTGATSCNATCDNNNSYDNTWKSATWTSSTNAMTNLCTINNCKAGSKYASANGGACTACAAGTYMDSTAHTTTSCKSADAGYYVGTTGAAAQTQCDNWTFSTGGATSCTSCPALTSGWSKSDSTSKGWTSYDSCKQTQKPANCASGGITQTATSATAWGEPSVTTDLTANANFYVGATSCPSCSSLGGGLYNTSEAGNSGGASACKATVEPGYYLEAKTYTKFTPCTAGYYCPGTTLAYSSTGGRTQCPEGYRDGATGYSQRSQCTITCPAGTRVESAKATCTTPSGNWYIGAHSVTYGNTSSVNTCAVATNLFDPSDYDVFWGWIDGNNGNLIKSYPTNAFVYIPVEPNTTYIVSGMGDATTPSGRYAFDMASAPVAGNKLLSRSSAGAKGKGIMITTSATAKYLGVFVLSDTDKASTDTRNALVAANVANLQIFKADAGYGIIGNTASDHDASNDCTITCTDGQYVASSGAACSAVANGQYKASHSVKQGSTSTPNNCSDLSGVPSGVTGKYTSVSPRANSANCRFTGNTVTKTGCSTVSANTVSYSGSAWGTGYYTAKATKGYYVSGTNSATPSCTLCPAGKYQASDDFTGTSCTSNVSCGYYSAKGGTSATGTCVSGQSCGQCQAGTYSATGAGSCTPAPAGSFVGTAGACEATQCVQGAYTSTTGQSACIACGSEESKSTTTNDEGEEVEVGTWGLTTTGAGQTSCNATCGNATGAKGWETSVWNSNNTVDNLCIINSCKGNSKGGAGDGFYFDSENNSCELCSSLAGGLFPHSSTSGTTKGTEACFLYTTDIPGYYIDITEDGEVLKKACPKATYSVGKKDQVVHYGTEKSSCTNCTGNTYQDETGATECKACPAGYTAYWGGDDYDGDGKEGDGHIDIRSCRIICQPGSYIANAGDSECTSVGAGYYAPATPSPYIAYGTTSERGQCPSGLTTIGYGAGADEAGDCGRILHVGEGKMYLRSDRKTERTLNVKVGNDTFYGNMSTEDKYMSHNVEKALKLDVGGTEYSVYDDSGESYIGGDSVSLTLDPSVKASSAVPAGFNDANGLDWSVTMADGTVLSGVGACDSRAPSDTAMGAVAAAGFEPDGTADAKACWCKMTSPNQSSKWILATNNANSCATKCSHFCASGFTGVKDKNVIFRTNIYNVSGISTQ